MTSTFSLLPTPFSIWLALFRMGRELTVVEVAQPLIPLCALQLLFAFAGCSEEHGGSAATLLQATGSWEHDDGESVLSKFILVLSCWQTLRATSSPQLGK
jgi:hypothetical protein